MVISEGNT